MPALNKVKSNVEIIWKYCQTLKTIFTQLKIKTKNVKNKDMEIMLHFLRMKNSYLQGNECDTN